MTSQNIKKNKGPVPYEAKGFRSGFVLLFAVTLAALLAGIAIGVSNIAQREVKFSTNARATNDAFFAADTGVEKALFDDIDGTICAPASSCSFSIPALGAAGLGCVYVEVSKTASLTTIVSKGYNVGAGEECGSTDPNRIQRELKVTY